MFEQFYKASLFEGIFFIITVLHDLLVSETKSVLKVQL